MQTKGFQPDTWVNGIGDLFKLQKKQDDVNSNTNRRWGINLHIHPSKEKGSDSCVLTHAPLFVRGTVINPKNRTPRKGYIKKLVASDTSYWTQEQIKDCPAADHRYLRDGEQYCFVFFGDDGTQIYLPQFELARVLFFNNAYLTRTSMEHGQIDSDFFVELFDDGSANIEVKKHNPAHIDLFSQPKFREFLAYILTDESAKQSYDSIGQNQLEYGRNNGSYRLWTFSFTPPNLDGCEMELKGRFDHASNTMLVDQIISLRNLPTTRSFGVTYTNPNFVQYVPEKGQGGGTNGGGKPPEQQELGDDDDPSGENNPYFLNHHIAVVAFTRPCYTEKHPEKKRPTGKGRSEDGESDDRAKGEVSNEESGHDGKKPAAEWDGIEDETDDSHLYLDKFKCYFEMLDLLETEHECVIERYPLRKLPAVGRCKKHLLEPNHTPRCISVSRVTKGQRAFFLLEVDTSDQAKSLSTKVIIDSGEINMNACIHEIEKELLKKSLSWPKDYFDAWLGENGHFWIAHQMSSRGGALMREEIIKWARRVNSNL